VQIARFAVLGSLTVLSGCASIVEGSTQTIAVATPPADGARCILTSSEGVYYVTTPGNATVHKTKNDIDVLCKKDGFQEATYKIESHFNGATAGNILAGGIIGMGVDAATGANYNFPAEVKIPMTAIQNPGVATDSKPSETTVLVAPGS
jgi:phosphoketolase